MVNWQFLEHGGQLSLVILGEQLIHSGQVFLVRASGSVLIHIEDESPEQIALTVIPEVVPFAFAGISNDYIGQDLSKKSIAIQVGHAIP